MSDTPPAAPGLLTLQQAAARAKLSESGFRKLIYRGVGPKGRMHSNKYKFLPEEIDEWLLKGWKGRR
jgi:hypothetical protein